MSYLLTLFFSVAWRSSSSAESEGSGMVLEVCAREIRNHLVYEWEINWTREIQHNS